MSACDKLVIVDDYEERHDNRTAVLQACNVMLNYLVALKRPLPEVAAQAVDTAQNYCSGALEIDGVREAEVQTDRFLEDTNRSNDNSGGAISVVRASRALVSLLREPVWGGGASEALSNFLVWVDDFEQDHALFEQLLERAFAIRVAD